MPTPIKKEDQEFKDYTKERDDRCYKVVQKMMKYFIDEKIFITDMPYLRKVFHSLLQEFCFKIIIDNIDQIFNLTEAHLKRNLDNADMVLWNKHRDDVTVEDIEQVLTKKQE